MPHKRAKSSVRAEERKQKGADLAPPRLGFETTISKRAAWVLGAEQVRKEFHDKKKRRQDGDDDGAGSTVQKTNKKRKKNPISQDGEVKSPHTIRPGESLAHFNKRIEADFRPTVRAAIKATSVSTTTKRLAKSEAESSPSLPSSSSKSKSSRPSTATAFSTGNNSQGSERKQRNSKTEFDSLPLRASLRDVALAPPILSRATRNAPAKSDTGGGAAAGLSMAQRASLKEERERVIKRYREIKEVKRVEAQAAKAPNGGNRQKRKRNDEDE